MYQNKHTKNIVKGVVIINLEATLTKTIEPKWKTIQISENLEHKRKRQRRNYQMED